MDPTLSRGLGTRPEFGMQAPALIYHVPTHQLMISLAPHCMARLFPSTKGGSRISILARVWESFLLVQAFVFAEFTGLHVPDGRQTTNLYLFIFQRGRNR